MTEYVIEVRHVRQYRWREVFRSTDRSEFHFELARLTDAARVEHPVHLIRTREVTA